MGRTGSYKEGGVVKACYWENGTRIDLHKGTGDSYTSSITVVGSDVYVAGSYKEGGVNKACYWKNGIRTDLSGGGKENTSSIAVVGSDVYITGQNFDYYVDGKTLFPGAFYWKNNTKINLPGFASAGETVTVDGRRTNFPEGVPTFARSITVVGSDVYVAGDYYLDGTNHRPCYWKNGKRTDLPFEGSSLITVGRMPEMHSTQLTSITVAGSDIYVAGNYVTGPYGNGSVKAQYWKNNNRIDLPVGKDYSSFAQSIAIVGPGVYVAGYYYAVSDPYESRQYKACYWKGPTKIDLPVPSGATESYAYSIVVK